MALMPPSVFWKGQINLGPISPPRAQAQTAAGDKVSMVLGAAMLPLAQSIHGFPIAVGTVYAAAAAV